MKKMSLTVIITSTMLLTNFNTLFSQDFEGYAAGLNISYPIAVGEILKDQESPSVGIVVDTPHEFDLGSYAVGVGAGIELVNMGAEDENFSYTSFYLSLSSMVYETPAGPLSVYAGGGWFGSLGGTGAVMLDYALPDQPIVIQPYFRGTFITDSGVGGDNPTWILSIGAIINYDISTLF